VQPKTAYLPEVQVLRMDSEVSVSILLKIKKPGEDPLAFVLFP